MPKSIRIFLLVLLPVLFTSCVDYVQSVSYKNGKYQMYYKVTLSKVLFAMAEEDPEQIFNGFDKEALGDLPENVSVRRVNEVNSSASNEKSDCKKNPRRVEKASSVRANAIRRLVQLNNRFVYRNA